MSKSIIENIMDEMFKDLEDDILQMQEKSQLEIIEHKERENLLEQIEDFLEEVELSIYENEHIKLTPKERNKLRNLSKRINLAIRG